MGDRSSWNKSSEGHSKAMVRLPEFFPMKTIPFDKIEQETAAQAIDNKSPNGSLSNSHEQLPYGSPDKTSSKSSDESSEKSYHGRDSSSSYSSHDTELIDVRESEEYIASSDKERRRLVKKQDKICRMAKKSRLRRKIKAGKKAQAKEREDLSMWAEIKRRNLGKIATFKVESSRVQESCAAEDRARDQPARKDVNEVTFTRDLWNYKGSMTTTSRWLWSYSDCITAVSRAKRLSITERMKWPSY